MPPPSPPLTSEQLDWLRRRRRRQISAASGRLQNRAPNIERLLFRVIAGNARYPSGGFFARALHSPLSLSRRSFRWAASSSCAASGSAGAELLLAAVVVVVISLPSLAARSDFRVFSFSGIT